ncbi:uncharacterized protein EV420DRAFT_200794 [Desarmillaria tabescens]|uniref:Heterokaryon incompatibility domain-containing protein n=1 Tax=Armillaria tabescens TaxID=1929756 RepID=A0AA39J8G1_ARMTA|nr:uncharacterized protein EV420DRAFT_200794 [Desarmillaria tabescens]KAK0437292.1 hypothetical protein EV420DRAFT_200794 [Desarmillaria tabescens]
MMIADTHDNINIVSQLSPSEKPDLTRSILEAEQSKKRKRDESRKMATYHENSISALKEAGCKEAIQVPLQRKYSGRKPIISNSLANTPCASLGADEVLHRLNTLLGTPYTLTTSLSSLLQSCISANYDFGTAYSRLRPGWFTDLMTIKAVQLKLEAEDQETRKHVSTNNQIRVAMPPRRVWDLYSNRIVLYCFILEEPWAVEHDWEDEKDLVSVTTPINAGEWPVPIPKDTNLNFIRIELLNLGAEYVWLDTLCLRQKGGKREDLRKEEWISDGSTIGNVFRWSEVVVHYLNGLGKVSDRTSLKRRHLDICDRSWFHCAWTLPEVNNHDVVAGYVPTDTEQTEQLEVELTNSQKPLAGYMNDGLQDAEQTEEESRVRGVNLFAMLASMQNRVSINPVDKIAGLIYPLRSHTIPTYYESESLEEAWTTLVNTIHAMHRGQLLAYPEPGDAGTKWRPSWDQVMAKPLPVDRFHPLSVYQDEEMDEDFCDEFCIEKVYVRGLAMVEGFRHGELIAKDTAGIEYVFNGITASHRYPIPEDTYTLLIPSHHTIQSPLYCVAGKRLPGKRFVKVSVFEMPDSEEVKRLEELGIAVKDRHILV